MKSFDSFTETDLVAYHLHLLSPQQELAVRTALTLNPRLAAEAKAIAATLHIFDRQEYPTMIGTAVFDYHWQRLRPSLKPHRARSPFAAWMLPLTLAAAVALLLIIAFWLFSAGSLSSSPQQAATPQTSSPTPTGPSSPSPIPPASHVAAIHTSASDQHKNEPILPPFSRISIPSTEPSFEYAPLNTTLAFTNLPNEPARSIAPLSTSAVPTPQPTTPPAAAPEHAKVPHKQTDVSIGVFGNFVATRIHNIMNGSTLSFQTQSATPTAGIAGSFHQQFRPWLGYRIATSYIHSNITYSNGQAAPSFYSTTTIPASVHELTAAYTAQGPASKRVTTDAELGGGVLVFVPSPGYTTNSGVLPSGPAYVNYNYRLTGVGGVGANFHISRRLDLRTEYRALVYEAPSFRILPNTHHTVASEPTVSLTYHFGSTTK